MASSVAQLNDIEEQELDIFDELGGCNFEDEPSFCKNLRLAKLKAKQQLALSDDSPFAHLYESDLTREDCQQSKKERAALLRKETNQMREQLDLVKLRLHEMKTGKSTRDTNEQNANEETQPKPAIIAQAGGSIARTQDTRYRPLTGKADCPNCACDTRRRSICDLCMKLNSTSSLKPKETHKCFVNYTNDYDNRPIRPAKERTLASVEVSTSDRSPEKVIDDVVVPGKVYTISKSLNDKRTKLAQAIDELQSMMEQVKAKSNKLDEERKLVQLYKDQWKYGPSIGGPKSSSRERIGLSQQSRNYQSRLDANLARDSKSLMGFKHIEPSMKLRQYNKAPVAIRKAVAKKVQSEPKKSSTSMRSKSLESLRQVQKGEVPPHVVINENFQNGKASSEINLRNTNEDDEEAEERIEEAMDATGDDNGTVAVLDAPRKDNDDPADAGAPVNDKEEEPKTDDGKVARMTWIPVFGETEIKTVKKATTRKVRVVEPSNQRANVAGAFSTRSQAAPLNRYRYQKTSTIVGNNTKRLTISPASQRTSQPPRADRIFNEANRRLKFATNLLEQERSDSRSKNQLLVNKRTPILTSQSEAIDDNNYGNWTTVQHSEDKTDSSIRQSSKSKPEVTARPSVELSESSRHELARIEEMVNEQQKLLNRLSQLQENRQQVVSPVTVTCPSACCMAHRVPADGYGSQQKTIRARLPAGRSLLVNTLKDRLNKGKLQLARTLEHEREKHQQLKLKVDSSLRKQSDLQHENELLKQSLSKCIDTCLKDISNTFESLSDTLTAVGVEAGNVRDQAAGNNQPVDSSNEDLSSERGQVSALSQAAQFMTDNKYLKQLKAHIEAIEQQRRSIFEELKKEKQRSMQLETRLKESQTEMTQLDEVKRKLEVQLKSIETNKNCQLEPEAGCSKGSRPVDEQGYDESARDSGGPPQVSDTGQPGAKETDQVESETVDQQSSLELDDSQGSVELYRRYIESMSPDIESIRRERKMILSEFDNIKKMLAVMDQ